MFYVTYIPREEADRGRTIYLHLQRSRIINRILAGLYRMWNRRKANVIKVSMVRTIYMYMSMAWKSREVKLCYYILYVYREIRSEIMGYFDRKCRNRIIKTARLMKIINEIYQIYMSDRASKVITIDRRILTRKVIHLLLETFQNLRALIIIIDAHLILHLWISTI